jgi:hypothetical protein
MHANSHFRRWGRKRKCNSKAVRTNLNVMLSSFDDDRPRRYERRITELENRFRTQQLQLENLKKENERLKRDMRFFEQMLFEEYKILIHLLNKGQNNIRIH